MKHVMQSDTVCNGTIGSYLDRVKKIVATFNKAVLNSTMPDGISLLQEVPIRFGSTCDVVERFLKVSHLILEAVVDQQRDYENNICAYYADLTHETLADETLSFPALENVVHCFKPVRHAETNLKAAKTPLLIAVSPVFKMLNMQLYHMKRGGSRLTTY